MPITVGDAIKRLEKAGFTATNQVGSHRKFCKGDCRFIIVIHRSPKETLCPKQLKRLNNLLNNK